MATPPIPADWPGVRLESVRERYLAGIRPILNGVTVAVALIVVIVAANVAVLMLLRGARREREIAVDSMGMGGVLGAAAMHRSAVTCGPSRQNRQPRPAASSRRGRQGCARASGVNARAFHDAALGIGERVVDDERLRVE